MGHIDKTGLRHDYEVLNGALGLAIPPFSPGQYVSRFAATLAVADAVRERAFALVGLAAAHG